MPDDRLRILAGRHLAEPFHAVLEDLSDAAYWIEPRAKGTCPVLAWASWQMHQCDPEAVMVSLHADHRVHALPEFQKTIRAAAEIARAEDVLVCVGAVPDRIEMGFGHVERGEALSTGEEITAHRVTAFHEKPDAQTAQQYVRDGHLWNTGIFVWKVSTFLSELAEHAPEVSECLTLLGQDADAFFDAVPVCVVDRAVMERSGRVAIVEALFSWDDVGSWESLSRSRPADPNENILIGDAVTVEGRGNIAFADQGNVVLFGVDDLVVVRTGETTLVMPRERAAHLKDLMTALKGSEL